MRPCFLSAPACLATFSGLHCPFGPSLFSCVNYGADRRALPFEIDGFRTWTHRMHAVVLRQRQGPGRRLRAPGACTRDVLCSQPGALGRAECLHRKTVMT